MGRNNLIVFTGIDGSGKTTQAELLIEGMNDDGIGVSYVWSRWKPFLLRPIINRWKRNVSGDVNKAIQNSNYNKIEGEKQKLLNNPLFRWLWLAAFFIDYGLQIFIKIRLKLFCNKLIISDRIFYDSIIDQAINLGKRKDRLLDNLDTWWMRLLFPRPDLVIFIDCPEDIAFSRKDDAPNIEYLENRRNLYLELADRYGWVKLDGSLALEDIAVQIKDIVYKRLNR